MEQEELVSFVFPDYKLIESIRYELPSDLVLMHEITLKGFEIYLVEQWYSERKLSTLITTYTGSLEDQITATQLTLLSSDESIWPQRLKSYMKELLESQHCKRKETDNGIIYVTNLSQFPSNLNLIAVKQGNMKHVWELFNVNLNLKKMGCSGRSMLTLSHPSRSTEDKFRQTFKILPEVDITFAARELVLIVQTFLYYYNLFPANFCDGTLCDHTEASIQNWWDTVGNKYYGMRPKQWEGLSATSVCAIVSFTLSIKMRLEMLNTSSIDVPKDPLNVERFRLAIGQFQKHSLKYSTAPQAPAPPQTLSSLAVPGVQLYTEDYSYFLDKITIDNLMSFSNHKMSTQLFKNDFNKVKKMLKNTVSDISSGRTYLNLSSSSAALPMQDSSSPDFHDLDGFNDMLTIDIDKMIHFIQGKRLIYLWKGKGKQVNIDDVSLAKSIRDQLEKQRHHAERDRASNLNSAAASHTTMEYLSLPAIAITETGSSRNSDKRRYSSNGKSSTNGSTNGLDIYDTEGSFDNESDKRNLSIPVSKFSDDSQRDSSVSTSDIWLLMDNNKNFHYQLKRRSSFPFMGNELNNSIVLHHQDFLDDESAVVETHVSDEDQLFNRLKRTNSFSLLEPSILTWDYPFSPSINRIAAEYLSIKEELKSKLKESNDAATSFIADMERYLLSEEHMTSLSANSKKIKKLSDQKAIDELYNKVTSKSEYIDLKVKDIELLNSRLTYDVRLLSNKVKDVEDNLRHMQDFKLKKVIENLSLYEAQRPEVRSRLREYQALQLSLSGDAEEDVDQMMEKKSPVLASGDDKNSFVMILWFYLLAMWHEISKKFSLEEHKTVDDGTSAAM